MRPFLHIFSVLLIPVSLIIAVLLTLFFTFEYSFTQAMSLGVLYGIFSGVFVTIILSFAFILFKESKERIQNKRKMKQNEKDMQENADLIHNENINKGIDHKLMLLMNKELTFELILTMIKKQVSHSITTHNVNKGSIDIKIHGETISVAITPLTKHTSQIVINSMRSSKAIQDILSFLKEKEHSFLQY
jgi:uncharacterized membrane protein